MGGSHRAVRFVGGGYLLSLVNLLARCEMLRVEERFEDALRLLETAETPDEAAVLTARAAVLTDLGRMEDALACFRRVLEENAANPEARFGLCFTLYLLERWPEALTELEVFVAACPDYANAAWLRAGLLRRLYGDRDARVLDAYALVVQVDPANAYAQLERADALRACGRYEEARDVYTRYASLATEDEALRVEAVFKLGCVSLVLQDNDAARSAFRAVLDAAPDYPDAEDMYAFVNKS